MHDKLHQFNIYAVPVQRELGGFDKDISKMLDLSSEHLYALFLVAEMNKAKSELEREQIRMEAPARFAEYMAEKKELLSRVDCSFSQKALACIYYNEKLEAFCLDQEAYLKDSYIVAKTPRELAALAKLEAALEALNAFDWTKIHLKQVFTLKGQTLCRRGTGKFMIREDLASGTWEDLLKGFKG